MQKRLKQMGLIRPKPRPPTKEERLRSEVGAYARRFDREKLYQEVWEMPVVDVAKQYGVSGSYVKRVCPSSAYAHMSAFESRKLMVTAGDHGEHDFAEGEVE